MESELGPCAEFSIYHLVDLAEGEERLMLDDTSNALYRQRVFVMGSRAAQMEAAQKTEPALPLPEQRVPAQPGHLEPNEPDSPAPPKTLGDIARVLRSKNAGPYEITFDVMFQDASVYQLVKSSDLLNATIVAELNGLRKEDIIWSGFFDQALAYKATIPRLWRGKPRPSGGFMENDVHGSQKYIPLLNMPLSSSFLIKWEEMTKDRVL